VVNIGITGKGEQSNIDIWSTGLPDSKIFHPKKKQINIKYLSVRTPKFDFMQYASDHLLIYPWNKQARGMAAFHELIFFSSAILT